jgi:hypothetical protein
MSRCCLNLGNHLDVIHCTFQTLEAERHRDLLFETALPEWWTVYQSFELVVVGVVVQTLCHSVGIYPFLTLFLVPHPVVYFLDTFLSLVSPVYSLRIVVGDTCQFRRASYRTALLMDQPYELESLVVCYLYVLSNH